MHKSNNISRIFIMTNIVFIFFSFYYVFSYYLFSIKLYYNVKIQIFLQCKHH